MLEDNTPRTPSEEKVAAAEMALITAMNEYVAAYVDDLAIQGLTPFDAVQIASRMVVHKASMTTLATLISAIMMESGERAAAESIRAPLMEAMHKIFAMVGKDLDEKFADIVETLHTAAISDN